MPARGSAIGASATGGTIFGGPTSPGFVGGLGGATGRGSSPVSNTVYASQGQFSQMFAPSGGFDGPVPWLVVLVAIEFGIFWALRHGFRADHGG